MTEQRTGRKEGKRRKTKEERKSKTHRSVKISRKVQLKGSKGNKVKVCSDAQKICKIVAII